MKNYLQPMKIFISFALLSIILSLLLVPVNQEAFAAHIANHTDCVITDERTNGISEDDRDCDGLTDMWEEQEYYEKTVGGSTIRVNLTDADPLHRDSYVEIDYMTHHRPYFAAIDPTVVKFNGMELVNPDGTTGVRLHFITSDNIPHKMCINIWTDSDGDDTNDFDNIKKDWMGTSSERLSNPNFYEAKKDVYRYTLFIHTRCGTIDDQKSAGGAETAGNDAFVSLGYPGWGNVINGHDTGSTDYKSRAFMHEYGHNFGLRHGGSGDSPNCKPNYISIMNYLFEFPTKVPSFVPDYSHNMIIPELDEGALVEADGIGPSELNGLPTAIGHSTTFSHSIPPYHDRNTYADNRGVNYNWYTGNLDYFDTVRSSITNFHFNPCNDNVEERLFGFDDVHYTSLTFWATSGPFQNSTGVPMASDVGPDITPADDLVPTNNISNVLTSKQMSLQNNESLPCDPDDPHCKLFVGQMLNNTNVGVAKGTVMQDLGQDFNNTVVGVENRTIVQELTIGNVLEAISSKVLDINQHLQELEDDKFNNTQSVPNTKRDFQFALVDAPRSVYNLINDTSDRPGHSESSNRIDEALKRILVLRNLVDDKDHPTKPILKPEYNVEVLKLIDDLTVALEKKR